MPEFSSSKKKRFAEATRRAAIHLAKQQGRRLTLSWLGPAPFDGPSRILPRLYLGDYCDASNESQLRSLGVTHILSVLETCPPFAFEETFRRRLKMMHLPLRDTVTTNILKHLDNTTEFIHKALQDPNSVVLVHCFQGVSRSATVVAAYLLATSTDFDSASSVLRFLKEKRFIVFPNFSFVSQLDDYAAICLKRRRTAQKRWFPARKLRR